MGGEGRERKSGVGDYVTKADLNAAMLRVDERF